MTRGSRLGALALVALAAVAPAAAATHNVPADFATIQLAVAAAGPGDTIVIADGTYTENVIIPPGLDGLRVFGSYGSPEDVIVDAAPGGTEGIGFDVRSANVLILGLTVRHATTGIRVVADGVSISQVEIRRTVCVPEEDDCVGGIGINLVNVDDAEVLYSSIRGTQDRAILARGHRGVVASTEIANCDGDGLRVVGDNWTVEGNSINMLEDGTAVSLEGNGHLVQLNTVGRTERRGILVVGDDAVVLLNTIVNTNNVGLGVEGDRAEVRKNTLRWASGGSQASLFVEGHDAWVKENAVHGSRNRPAECVGVIGDRARVDDNTVEGCGEDGIEVTGDAMEVTDNLVRDARRDCYDLECTDLRECSEPGEISNNFAYDCAEDDGYDLDFPITAMLISYNYANGAGDRCFQYRGGEGQLYWNNAFNCGAGEQGECYRIFGDENELIGNQAQHCQEDGFDIRGAENLLDGNIARWCLEDGIDIEFGDGNILINNVAQNNHAEGIENGGTNTVMTSNSANGNRGDLNCAVEPPFGFAPGSPSMNVCYDGTEFLDSQEID